MGKKFLELDKQFDDEGNLTVMLQNEIELILYCPVLCMPIAFFSLLLLL